MQMRLKPNVLLNIGRKAENAHSLAMRAGRSYPAVRDYIAGDVRRLDLDVLVSILVGQGMTKEQVLALRIGDLFEFREDDAGES